MDDKTPITTSSTPSTPGRPPPYPYKVTEEEKMGSIPGSPVADQIAMNMSSGTANPMGRYNPKKEGKYKPPYVAYIYQRKLNMPFKVYN